MPGRGLRREEHAFTFTACTASQCSSDTSRALMRELTPALFTRMCSPPRSAAMVSKTRGDGGGNAHVEVIAARLAACGLELPHEGFDIRALGRQVRDGNGGARLRERGADGPAYALAAAGNDGNHAVQSEGPLCHGGDYRRCVRPVLQVGEPGRKRGVTAAVVALLGDRVAEFVAGQVL